MMSVATDEQPSQQEVIDSCLHALLGCDSLQDTGSMQLLRREHLGSVVHTFSHIQQTMHVELLTFQVSTHAHSYGESPMSDLAIQRTDADHDATHLSLVP